MFINLRLEFIYLVYLSWTSVGVYVCTAKDSVVNYVIVNPGKTIVLRYNYTATTVDWSGPNHEDKKVKSEEEKDMYGTTRKWNVARYTSNGHLNPLLPHKERLQIVGNITNGQFYLQIKNISTYDAGLYICDIFISKKTAVRKRFIIQVNQSSELEINYGRFDVINEGQSLNLCCHSKNVYSNQTLRWFNELHGMQEQRLSSTCFHFNEIFRNDSGVYTCIAEYEGGIGTKNITLVVSYSPSVKLIYNNFTERDKKRVIQCIVNGHPMNYSYRQWEHKTLFDEHIRYLTGNATGFLSLPIQKRQLRYQDTGVYVCSVSNGIPYTRGKQFQKEQAYIISKGTPRFVTDNTNRQYGREGHQLDVKLQLYSLSNITCQLIESKGDFRMTPSVNIHPVNVSAYFHGKNVKVLGLELKFRFPELSITDFKEYIVTVCNEFGNSSFTLELLPRKVESKMNFSKSLIATIICSILLTLIIVAMAKCIVDKRKTNGNSYSTTQNGIEPVEGQSEAVENVLYQSNNQERHNNLEISPVSTLLPGDTSSENTLSEPGTMTYNSEQAGHVMAMHLNYADVVFQPSSSQNEVRIIGLEDRCVYADVDTAGFAGGIPARQSDTSSSEDDFVYVEGIENYIDKRETND